MKPLPVFVIVAIAVTGMTHAVAAGIIAGLAVVGIWFARDVKRRPKVKCRDCGGSGDSNSVFRLPFSRRPAGACGKCGGKKAAPRMALRFVDPGQRARILTEARNARNKIGN